MATPPPKWLKKPEDRLELLSKTYQQNVKTIATRMASHNQLSHVDERHVDHAHDALVVVGLSLLPWYGRPQIKSAFGGALIGGGFSMIDVVPLLPLPSHVVTPASWVVFAVLVISGALLLIWSWAASH